jgi:molybdopterin-containing oxidoreductase family iron-sulfur binding subunit
MVEGTQTPDIEQGSPGKFTRRRLLGGIGVVAGAAAATVIPLAAIGFPSTDETATAKASTNRQWAFVIDLRRCDGCKKCTLACQKEHSLPKDHEWIRVVEVKGEEGSYFFPRICQQCENPPCLKVCPTGATFKNPEGVILVDQDRCIGCRMCMAACPYEARYFNYDDPIKPASPFDNPMPEFPVPQQKGTVGKCVLCVHNADKGKLPFCVGACTMDALFIADLNSDVMTNASGETYQLSKYLRDNDAFRYKEELNTSPRVWYVAGHAQDLDF